MSRVDAVAPTVPEQGAVDLWWLWLDVPAARWWPVLNAPERRRATRLPTADVRRRYVVRRGLLRALLARLTARDPAAVDFAATPGGRPVLAGFADLRFSASHRGPLGVVAVAHRMDVGVDVERVEPSRLTPATVAYVLTERERAALAGLTATRQVAAFHLAWTAKEAVAKATGWGMRRCLHETEVRTGPDGQRAIHQLGGSRRQWPINIPCAPVSGHAVALVTTGRLDRVVPRTWTGG